MLAKEKTKFTYPALVAFLFALTNLMVNDAALAGDDELRLRAELIAAAAAGDVSGKADFRDRRARRKFSVEIEGFAEGQMFDVLVNGANVGTIVVDAAGFGNLDYDDTAGPGDLDDPFPPGFPVTDGGETVTVGPLSGALQPK